MMFDVLLEAALRATFIAAAVLVALWSLRVRTAAVRHRVWTVVTVAMLALPLSIAYAPDVSLRVLPPAHAEAPEPVASRSDPVGLPIAPLELATSEAVELTPARPIHFDGRLVEQGINTRVAEVASIEAGWWHL